MRVLSGSATVAALASLSIIAGCVTGIPRSAESALEGQWTDAGGVGISSFNNGEFVTVARDTGERLSEGTYQFRNNRNVEIQMYSLVRGSQVNVDCALVSPTRLNCTNTQGQNFVLTRRS